MAKEASKKPRRQAAKPNGKKARRVKEKWETDFLRGVGQKIKAKRLAAGLTARELAENVEITMVVQYKREAGHTDFPSTALCLYAREFKCQPEDLMCDLPDMPVVKTKRNHGTNKHPHDSH